MLVNSMYCLLVSGYDSAIGEVCAITKFGIIAAICLCDCIISAKNIPAVCLNLYVCYSKLSPSMKCKASGSWSLDSSGSFLIIQGRVYSTCMHTLYDWLVWCLCFAKLMPSLYDGKIME